MATGGTSTRTSYNYKESLGVTKSPTQDAYQNKTAKTELSRMRAVGVIERWWRVVKDRKVFFVLKQAICASEYSLTQEILRKVTPAESELLADPAIQAKIKFRFGGEHFPPFILFKIFTSMNAADTGLGRGGVKYISGKRMIRPASEAAADAKRQMGNKKFYDQMLEDACLHHQLKVTDEVDVVNMKDYMQFTANVDESPAYLGGKDNTWRRLNLSSLPRYTPLHNLLDLLEESRLAGNVTLHQLKTLTNSTASLTQQQQIRAISSLSETLSLPSQRSRVRPGGETRRSGSQRRSRQAKRRVEMMKKVYREEGEESPGAEEGEEGVWDDQVEDDQVEDLYQWTQSLSFDDIR